MRSHPISRIALVAYTAVAGSATGLAWSQETAPDGRIIVRTIDDLPRRTYDVRGSALEFIRDDAKFFPLLDRVISDTLADLKGYKIEDAATLRGYYEFLGQAYLIKGDIDTAIAYSDRARELESKEQEKLMRGVTLRARQAALRINPDDRSAPFAEAFKAELKRAVSGLPFEPIKDQLIQVTSQARMVTPELVEASIAVNLDPLIASNEGKVPSQVAAAIIATRATLDFALPVIPLMAEVYGEILSENANSAALADVWTPRLVSLDPSADATPVVIGIWDSGVDTTLYPDNLWTNPDEVVDGRDNDGNGFVDDVHGIAFDLDRRRTVGPLADISGLKGDKDQLVGFIAASQDMQAGVQNEGVEAFQAFYKTLDRETLRDFSDDMSLLGSWAHGTHVAGIAIAGNPMARILHITENWPYKSIPDRAPTVEDGERWGDSFRQAVAYLKQADARVVNMSWRIPRAAFESMLEAKGVGATPEERAEISRAIFAELRDGLEEAIRSAPEILFIAGSGNEDNDVDFAEYIPAGLRLPNLLTVGAVDAHDRFTTFTSTGSNVELYANGYRIESSIPGGQRIEFSGTSMAAPQVANLAAKILALRPELTPGEVVELIRAHADPIPGRSGRFVVHPARTIEAVR